MKTLNIKNLYILQKELAKFQETLIKEGADEDYIITIDQLCETIELVIKEFCH